LVVVRSERRTQARLHGRRAKGPHSVAPANEDRDCRRDEEGTAGASDEREVEELDIELS
jgi:hypothetical protein